MKLVVFSLCCLVNVFAAQPATKTITVYAVGAIADHRRAETEKRDLNHKFQLPADASILDLLVAAGGIGDAGSPGKIRVKRTLPDGTIDTKTIDAASELRNYNKAFRLTDGDVVYIPDIFDDFPPPEFLNYILWGYGLFRSQGREPTTEWKDLLRHLGNGREGDLRRKADAEFYKQQALREYFLKHPNAPSK